MNITMVPSTEVDHIWGKVVPLLKLALDQNPGRYLPIDIYADLVTHKQVMWVAFEGQDIFSCCITRVVEYPVGRVLLLEWIGGSEMGLWLDLGADVMDAYAKDMGCKVMECVGRKGWERVIDKYGWQAVAVHYLREVKE